MLSNSFIGAMDLGHQLCKAALAGNLSLTKKLLNKDAPVDATDSHGLTPLHLTAREGHEQIVTLLIEHDASVGATTNNGCTPLHWAANNGHKQIVALLIQAGASVEAADNNSWTPLYVAASRRYEYEEIVTLLIEHGASVDAADNGSWTPLHRAADNGHEQIVTLLLQAGASVDDADTDGRTPLSIAVDRNYTRVIEVLKQPDTLYANGWINSLKTWLKTHSEHVCDSTNASKVVTNFECAIGSPSPMPEMALYVSAMRRCLITQHASVSEQLKVINHLCGRHGVLRSHPYSDTARHIQSFLPSADVVTLVQSFPLGLSKSGSTLAVLP